MLKKWIYLILSMVILSTTVLGIEPINQKSVEAQENSLNYQLNNTTNPNEIFWIGEAYFKKGNYADARNAYKRGTSDIRNLLGAAISSRLIADYSGAVKYYDQLIDREELLEEAYFGRGIAYRGLEEYNKAISDFTKSLEYGKREYTYVGLGDLYLLTGRKDMARSILEEGRTFFPNSELIKTLLGRAYK